MRLFVTTVWWRHDDGERNDGVFYAVCTAAPSGLGTVRSRLLCKCHQSVRRNDDQRCAWHENCLNANGKNVFTFSSGSFLASFPHSKFILKRHFLPYFAILVVSTPVFTGFPPFLVLSRRAHPRSRLKLEDWREIWVFAHRLQKFHV